MPPVGPELRGLLGGEIVGLARPFAKLDYRRQVCAELAEEPAIRAHRVGLGTGRACPRRFGRTGRGRIGK